MRRVNLFVLTLLFAANSVAAESLLSGIRKRVNLDDIPAVGAGKTQDGPAFKFAFDSRFENSTKPDFARVLAANSVSLDAWAAGLSASGVEFLCLGESHDNKYRNPMAERIFSRLEIDILMLEAVPAEVEKLQAEVAAGEETINHLGADIAQILRAVKARNPQVAIAGIEETDEQEIARRGRPEYERDSSIAENLMQAYRPGKRHVALYGSLHCARNSVSMAFQRPFYQHLLGVMDESKRVSALVVIGDNWSNKFSVFMKALNLDDKSFVIPDTSAIDPAVYNFNWDLRRYFDNYEAIIFLAK